MAEYIGGPRDGEPVPQRPGWPLPRSISFPMVPSDTDECEPGERVVRGEYVRSDDGTAMVWDGEHVVIAGAMTGTLRCMTPYSCADGGCTGQCGMESA